MNFEHEIGSLINKETIFSELGNMTNLFNNCHSLLAKFIS